MGILNLKETLHVQTIQDDKVHKYFISFTMDADFDEIMTTATLTCPFSNELMEYWAPITTGVIVRGGIFDYEDIFIGRVKEVKQEGYFLELTLQNLGSKFKEPADSDFINEYMANQPCVDVIKNIFDKLKMDYIIKLDGIPDYMNYTYDENGSVLFNDAEVTEVPDIVKTVESIKKYDVNKDSSRFKEILEAKENILNKLEEKQDIYSQTYYESYLTESLINYKQNYKIMISEDPIYSGDKTYEEIIREFCRASDAHFYIIDTTVYLVSYVVMFTRDKYLTGAKTDNLIIENWMIEDDSFELNVDQYGFYNTVEIKYKDGSVTESYEDLVRVFGEVKKVYEEKDIDRRTAEVKALAYLSAHIRDFGMTNKLKCLYTGKMNIGTFVTVMNPLTTNTEMFLIQGINVSFAEDKTFIVDLRLTYGPYNPDNPEIPEVGSDVTGVGIPSETMPESFDCEYPDVKGKPSGWNDIVNQADRGQRIPQEILGWAKQYPTPRAFFDFVASNFRYQGYSGTAKSLNQVVSSRRANCGDFSNLALAWATAAGYKAKRAHIPNHYYAIIYYPNGGYCTMDLSRKVFVENKKQIGTSGNRSFI